MRLIFKYVEYLPGREKRAFEIDEWVNLMALQYSSLEGKKGTQPVMKVGV